MDVTKYEAYIADLERENRILKQKFKRSEANRVMLEEALETHSRALKVRNMELEQSQELIRQSEAKYRDLAFHDTLTELPNRAFFRGHLDLLIAQAKKHHLCIGLFFIDVDKFKPVNDTLGHEAGDQVLIEMGGRLRACARSKDTIARIGGDEFAVLLEDLRESGDALLMAERILRTMDKPFIVYDKPCKISVSIGVSLFPSDGEDTDTLLHNADIAMYSIKKNGRNGYKFFRDISQR